MRVMYPSPYPNGPEYLRNDLEPLRNPFLSLLLAGTTLVCCGVMCLASIIIPTALTNWH